MIGFVVVAAATCVGVGAIDGVTEAMLDAIAGADVATTGTDETIGDVVAVVATGGGGVRNMNQITNGADAKSTKITAPRTNHFARDGGSCCTGAFGKIGVSSVAPPTGRTGLACVAIAGAVAAGAGTDTVGDFDPSLCAISSIDAKR